MIHQLTREKDVRAYCDLKKETEGSNGEQGGRVDDTYQSLSFPKLSPPMKGTKGLYTVQCTRTQNVWHERGTFSTRISSH